MCELLGLNFNRPVDAAFSFTKLLRRTIRNPDGWGAGYYPDDGEAANIFKEATPGDESRLATFLSSHQRLYSTTFLAHIRNASRGLVKFSNCHPFNRHYKALEFLFVHNGTLRKEQLRSRNRYCPLGETDSEMAFCYLLSKFDKTKIYPIIKGKYIGYSPGQIDDIWTVLHEINQDGSLTCIFSDGHTLFAYRDENGACNLHYMEVHQPMTGNKDDKRGFVMATVPLSDGSWVSFEPGQLLVFRNGQIVANRNF